MMPMAYYSISETTNHYFLLYSFYHADDQKHENDLEGCLLIVEKGNESKDDRLMGAITIAHLFFHKYSYKNHLESKIGLIEDMSTEYEEKDVIRPLVEQEKGGHGLYSLSKRDFFGRLLFLFNGTQWYDLVACYPPNSKEHVIEPYDYTKINEVKETPHFPTFYYKLIDMLGPDGLWDRRNNTETFKDPKGIFNTHGMGEAHAPWYWDTKLDNLEAGSIWTNPAKLANEYFYFLNETDS